MALDSTTTGNNVALIEDEGGFKIADLLENLIEYWKVALAVAVITFLIGLGMALSSVPIYRADALIQVESKKGSALSSLGQVGNALVAETSSIVGEIEILRSRNVISRALESQQNQTSIDVSNRVPVIGTWLSGWLPRGEDGLVAPLFGLNRYAWGGEELRFDEFRLPRALIGRPLQLLVGEGGRWQLRDAGGELIVAGTSGQEASAMDGQVLVRVEMLRAHPGTIFGITRNDTQVQAAYFAAGVSATESARGSSLIRLALEDVDPRRAARMVNAIADAYVQQNVERRSEEAEKSLTFLQSKLPELKRQVEGSENDMIAFRKREKSIDMSGEVQVMLQKSVALEKERVQAEFKRGELATRYADTHPTMKALERQIGQLRAEEGALNREVGALPSVQRDYLRLMRAVEVSNQLYVAMLNNAQQLQIAKAGTVGNVAIVDRAIVPVEPVRPNRPKMVSMGALLGLVLGVLAAQGMAMLTGRIRDPKKLEQETNLATYAILPRAAEQEDLDEQAPDKTGLIAAKFPTSPAVEALRSLRLALQFGLAESVRGKVVLITSALPGQGKSYVCANTAYLLAGSGKRVLLIDADVRRSSISRYFDVPRGVPGLTELLHGKMALESVLIAEVEPNVTLLPAGGRVRNPGELLASADLPGMIDKLAADYDYVLIDSPPLLPVMDAALLSKLADVTAFVVRQGQVSFSEVFEALEILARSGGKAHGLIFNGFVPSRVRYGYGRRYGYYRYGKKYGKSYGDYAE